MKETQLATQLRAWRASRNLSQAQAAIKLHLPLETYRGWEVGRRSKLAASTRAMLSAAGVFDAPMTGESMRETQ